MANNNIIFDKNTNAFKLKSLVSYKIEVKQKLNNIISNKPFRIFNANKTQLAEFDDLLIKKLHRLKNNSLFFLFHYLFSFSTPIIQILL